MVLVLLLMMPLVPFDVSGNFFGVGDLMYETWLTDKAPITTKIRRLGFLFAERLCQRHRSTQPTL